MFTQDHCSLTPHCKQFTVEYFKEWLSSKLAQNFASKRGRNKGENLSIPANISSGIGAKSFKLQCFCWVEELEGNERNGRFLSSCPWVSFCRGGQQATTLDHGVPPSAAEKKMKSSWNAHCSNINTTHLSLASQDLWSKDKTILLTIYSDASIFFELKNFKSVNSQERQNELTGSNFNIPQWKKKRQLAQNPFKKSHQPFSVSEIFALRTVLLPCYGLIAF